MVAWIIEVGLPLTHLWCDVKVILVAMKISRNDIICISKLSIYLKSISRIPNYRFLATCPRKQYKICSDPIDPGHPSSPLQLVTNGKKRDKKSDRRGKKSICSRLTLRKSNIKLCRNVFFVRSRGCVCERRWEEQRHGGNIQTAYRR